MSAYSYFDFEGAFPSAQASSIHTTPPKHDLPASPTEVELDSMAIGFGAHYTGPIHKPPKVLTHQAVTGSKRPSPADNPTSIPLAQASLLSNDLETSRFQSPSMEDTARVVQTWFNPSMNKWRILSACLMQFGNGCNDSAPGALLPYMERYYSVGYAIVSLIFVGNAIGFILAAFCVHTLDTKLGRARVLMLCDFVMLLGYTAMAVAPPFPVFVCGFFVTGLAMATNLALNNVFVANLANSTVILGLLHGSYGMGGVVAPIFATAMVTNGILFARFYIIILGMRFISLFFGGWAFWHFERDAKLSVEFISTLERPENRQVSEHLTEEPSKIRQLKVALKQRTTLIGAIFIFAYQGAEVSISGWVISFLITYRGGDPENVGYVTAGFWGGITVGRFILTHAASRVGEKMFVYGLVAGSAAFQLIVWFVPNVIGDSVAVALVGLLLGPIYPCVTVVFARLLPRHLQNTALAFVAGMGSAGGAIAPFATGILAQVRGTWVLHPVCIGLYICMETCWFLLPSWRKRRV